MSTKFFSKLSQNYIELLEDKEYCDVTVEVGKDQNMKIFRAHTNILCYRSSFLKQTLTSNRENKNDNLFHIKLPNISPGIFHTILRYIYGGIISLDDHNVSEILEILIAADELTLRELVEFLQEYLIENESEWIEQHFGLIHNASFQSNSLLLLQDFCTNFIAKFPEKVFKSLDFVSFPEKSLISLIERDDLQMKEIEIWEYVLKWGLERNPTILLDPITWSDDDFKIMENTLQYCLPLIRFFSLSSEEFFQKVHPYKKLIKSHLYEELLGSYLDFNFKPSNDILLPRYKNIDEIIDSRIVNLNIISLISRWIDKIDIKSKYAYTRELYLPYEFGLLLRGSQNGFSPGNFHKLCDDIPHTVTFIKIKGTEEIIGGYNPLKWKSPSNASYKWNGTKDSFIYSFKSKENFRESILSHVKDVNYALFYNREYGPTFGTDIDIYVEEDDDSKEYNYCRCKQRHYEKKIRNTDDRFSIEDYEVFRIIKKDT
ncbi:hypothetical protein RclHR1_01880012 [Rhizophagus clarus]|uniref:BTB domain-containing protein n=1 Tax=Rhizophagus clarus TaxID=94130 RepID=A0A2Z6R3F8_9GLOM|nr:hypothetical protein RclHR1_01880012 [Rhizophagus clarus]GES90256.1 hypothetical protein GLOIN_2v1779084 [Rhizophagus clarus]